MASSPTAPGVTTSHDDSGLRFPLFNKLPSEIRALIWEHAIPDDSPEVHILKPHSIRPHAYPTVDTAFPLVMHASHEARETCRRCLKFRPLDVTGLEVPCRPFRPELDIMYIGAFHFYSFFTHPEFFYGGVVRRLRHIAIDIVIATSAARVAGFVHYLDSLETIGVLFRAPGENHVGGEALPLAAGRDAVRRCRLRPFKEEEYSHTTVGNRTRSRDQHTVERYLLDVRKEIEHTVKETLLPSLEEGTMVGVWDYDRRKLAERFKIEAMAFEEYGKAGWLRIERQQMRLLV